MVGPGKIKYSTFSSKNTITPEFNSLILEEGEGYRITRIEIMPGKQFSFLDDSPKSENERENSAAGGDDGKSLKGSSKRWVIVKGAGKATVERSTIIMHTGETLYIGPNITHIMANPCIEKLVFIEIQGKSFAIR